MPKFVIEREIPGVGALTKEQLKSTSQKSREVLSNMGTDIQWNYSYVTADKIYGVYTAADVNMIREHAEQVGLSANAVSRVTSIIDPTTAE